MKLTRVAGPMLVYLLAGCALAGCGARTAGPGTPEPRLRGQFLSGSVTVAGQPHALVARTRISLEFTEDGRLIATAGCNTMSGTVRTGGGWLETDGLAVTELGCDPPRHAQDAWLAGILGAKPAWRKDGPALTITAGDTDIVLTDRETVEPDRALTGTTWAVDTIIDGQTASSTPAGVTATVRFGDGRVSIGTGCNDASATYTAAGDTVRFGRAVSTRRACRPDIMRLETAVLDVFRDEVTVELDGDRLTLTHPSGKGLQLHAE